MPDEETPEVEMVPAFSLPDAPETFIQSISPEDPESDPAKAKAEAEEAEATEEAGDAS